MLRPAALVALLLVAPVRADLNRAQHYLDRYEFSRALQEAERCRAEDPQRSELLQIWALENLLRGDEARQRLQSFRPDPDHSRLYLIVHAMLNQQSRRKDLDQAWDLSQTPTEKVDVRVRQFYAYPYPQDQQFWQEAAELAAQHPLPDELLARLSLAHIDMLCSLRRAQEGFAELALADRLLRHNPSRPWRIGRARMGILNALGRAEEAQAVRRALPAQAQGSLSTLTFWLREVEARSETSQTANQRILAELAKLQRRAQDWSRGLDLYAYRLRSSLMQTSRLGQTEWRRQADALCSSARADERLLGLSERALVLMSLGDTSQARADLLEAHAISKPHPGSELYARCQPHLLSLVLAQLEFSQNHTTEAQQWGERSLLEAQHNPDSEIAARLCLLTIYLRTGQMDQASRTLNQLMAQAEQLEDRVQRALAFGQVINMMIVASLDSTRVLSEVSPVRVDPDTPAGWLFAEIEQNPELQARFFKALDELKEQSPHPALKGMEGLFRALTLGSLGRSTEALDAYSQALQNSRIYGPLQANTALLYGYELWCSGRQQQALEQLAQAYQQAQTGGVFTSPDNYRLAYANALLRSAQPDPALRLVAAGLAQGSATARPFYLMLRGRATNSATDLVEALNLARQEGTRQEILFELDRLEPERHWLEQIKSRQPKLAVRLMRGCTPARAVEIGHESLEEFRESFEQLPTSARPAALRSPALQALIQAILEACIQANQPQEGAHCLAVWRSLQSQPGVVSPELEQLRAELTSLRSANDPRLAERVADTRAQFLSKLTQLRQLNPDMERSLSAQVSELLTLQPQLDGRTLLVQYYLASDGLYVQALTRDKQQLFKVNAERARLLEHLKVWSEALSQPRPLTSEQRAASRQLYAYLVEPLGELRQEHPDLWIMPGGELWDLPFETLLDSNDRYLLESMGCAYLGPSEAMQLSRPATAASGYWLGVSNQRLPGTQHEVEQLRGLFAEARLTRSWNELKNLAPEARILHLATHSQARPERATTSFIEMAEGDVTLEQIYDLRLAPGCLVVLSSCSGAAAQAHRERDLISLSSGFRAAGASSVVAALWPVDDEATAPFFTPMYQALVQGHSRLQALREAKLALVAKHPYYWAGFTLLGDPR